MSDDIRTQQRWLIAGVAILAIFLLLVVASLIRSIQKPPAGESKIGHRSPAADLAYCGTEDTKLCLLSFSQVEGGDMQVSLQLPSTIFPQFILVIDRFGVESVYECQRTRGFLSGMTCTGASQVPGETLQFKVFSRRDGHLMAEGKFAIIGIAIATPEPVLTTTPDGTPTGTLEGEITIVPDETSTPIFAPTFPTPGQITPSPTLPATTYP